MGDHMPQHPILRLGPGLHSRGMRAVGHAIVGTAGALPAHNQDALCARCGLGGESKIGIFETMCDPTLRL